jgi:glyoxylase-like metal-dependent hydrolase (beta-lactamase superfamily II)
VVREIDLMHLGHDRVIAAHLADGLIVDPGPTSCLDRLLAGLDEEPRGVLLTHIHLDHAGATGALVERFPGLRVWVHRIGAPHLVDPGKLLRSAGRLYGDDMDRLWGPTTPVPESSVTALDGGELVNGFRVAYTPGHASHHVAYLREASGDAFVGDVAGVAIPPSAETVMPTPPPEIDLEAWERSLGVIGDWEPERLRLTHFGSVAPSLQHLDRAREALRWAADASRAGGRAAFMTAVKARIDAAGDAETASRFLQAAPPDQLWLGLERYWQTRSRPAVGSSQ